MTPTKISPPPAARGASSRAPAKARTRSRRRRPVHGDRHDAVPTLIPMLAPAVASRRKRDPLGRYTDACGRTREVIAGRRNDGCVLVVDRDAVTLSDRRLVARLDADEPPENAALVCTHYLNDPSRGRCRRVSAEDLVGRLSVEDDELQRSGPGSPHQAELVARHRDGKDYVYRLELVDTDSAVAELRWRRYAHGPDRSMPTPVCLREVVGALESYEPVCELTLRALAMYREDPHVSSAVLGGQFERLRESPIVLNRKLRHAVLAAVECHGLSMSEIALRCGRVKRDRKGNCSGETSWLARRVGILPESSTGHPTPWVHSDVLALVARDGLGVSPREVELG
jgi:hypothetical protein